MDLPLILVQLTAAFSSKLKNALTMWGKEQYFDNSKTKKVLGIEFTPLKKTLLDMVPALIETGYIPDY